MSTTKKSTRSRPAGNTGGPSQSVPAGASADPIAAACAALPKEIQRAIANRMETAAGKLRAVHTLADLVVFDRVSGDPEEAVMLAFAVQSLIREAHRALDLLAGSIQCGSGISWGNYFAGEDMPAERLPEHEGGAA